jgi:large subunit ribosomal protein L4
LPNVLVVEPRYADPLSLIHFKRVLVTKAAIEQLKEMLA